MALLPHFNKQKNLLEPIYSNLFEVQYSCADLTEEESIFLTENTHKIKDNVLHLHLNEDENGGIEVMRLLQKMNKFTINVLLHNKEGKNIAIIIFRDCEFIDLISDVCDLSWDESDILKPGFGFRFDKSEYVDSTEIKNYKRRIKLERIIKEN